MNKCLINKSTIKRIANFRGDQRTIKIFVLKMRNCPFQSRIKTAIISFDCWSSSALYLVSTCTKLLHDIFIRNNWSCWNLFWQQLQRISGFLFKAFFDFFYNYSLLLFVIYVQKYSNTELNQICSLCWSKLWLNLMIWGTIWVSYFCTLFNTFI